MPNLTDLATVRELCRRHGFALSKGFGQNFIINPTVCPRMVEAAGIDRGFGVLEIGPGIGVLTKEAALRAAKVVAVEVDQRLPALLAETLAEFDNVKIVLADVLKTDLAALIQQEFAGLRVAVIANLPYYITSPILMKLLEERLPVESITVMVQREAAQRICAAPGSRQVGAISLAVQYYAEARTLFTVSPGSFTPPPKVTSAVIQLRPRTDPPVRPASEQRMFAVIRAAFSQRRKTAVNAISSGLSLPKPQVAAAVAALGRGELVRPEQLTLADFAALADQL
ncbi:MAG TPA: 16S rRNA (adenine(1518)-N(6)/adenine(1519)-N(6))-dimethyltransferase RsmA [Candidatus Pygmaiobacter gallistercoris]|nr:16S rRNA (adenine(1518)-N(6)/adenine(1519)-N(6))-dimethyltransferase RsmA [Candidatus Pygmaiobacter gallistercoris]